MSGTLTKHGAAFLGLGWAEKHFVAAMVCWLLGHCKTRWEHACNDVCLKLVLSRQGVPFYSSALGWDSGGAE